jgi:uncharacterized protein DUF2877
MHVLSAPPTAATQGLRGARIPLSGPTTTGRVALAIQSIGYLVPRADFTGRVHSVFAKACNFACDDTLLTLCAFGVGCGPATLRLAPAALHDLRDLFDAGEPVHSHQGRARTSRVELRWLHASVWRPSDLGPLLPRGRIETRLHCARQRLAQHRRTHASVIDRDGAPPVAALSDACRAFDGVQALRQVERLIGWGEGLTPAGDDFLVGLIAGLDASASADERRCAFRRVLAAALIGGTQRTTPIAAHYLGLAAGGHYAEPLIRLRHALLCEDDDRAVDAALRSALAVGATSGADTVSGLLAGLLAWLPAAASVEAT